MPYKSFILAHRASGALTWSARKLLAAGRWRRAKCEEVNRGRPLYSIFHLYLSATRGRTLLHDIHSVYIYKSGVHCTYHSRKTSIKKCPTGQEIESLIDGALTEATPDEQGTVSERDFCTSISIAFIYKTTSFFFSNVRRNKMDNFFFSLFNIY